MTTEELDILRLEDRLTPLTDVQQQQVLEALCLPHNNDILAYKYNIPVTRQIAKCLNPRLWLNDEVINFQMQLLQAYDYRLCANIPSRNKSHFFNIFFVTNLLRGGTYTYKNVQR